MQPPEICRTFLKPPRLQEVLGKLSTPQIKAVLKEGSIKVKLPGGFVGQQKRRRIWTEKIVGAIDSQNSEAAGELLQQWLLNHQRQLLVDYLDKLGVNHRAGETDESFLFGRPTESLREAAVVLFDSHPRWVVAAYLTYIAYQQKSNVFDNWEPLSPTSDELARDAGSESAADSEVR